jgi:methyl-accepting chemotaxis protein
MNPLPIYFLISVITFAIGCAVLKIIFGKSILFRVSILSITAMYVCCFLAFYSGVKGIWNLIWAVPAMSVFSIFVFMAINRIRKKLENVIHQLQLLSQGSLKSELTPSWSNDETGRLNNMLIHMLDNLKKMHEEIHESAGNLVSASQQTLDASAHLSKSSYAQTLSVEDVMTEIEHMQLKILNNKEISSAANIGIQESVKATQSAMEKNLQLEEKVNQINEWTSLNKIIAPELIAELSRSASDLTRQTVAILKESVVRINQMSKMIHEAYCLSGEQSNGMEAISTNIEKLDIMTQQNTVYSVELTACSEMLKEEAEKLKTAVSRIQSNE